MALVRRLLLLIAACRSIRARGNIAAQKLSRHRFQRRGLIRGQGF
jgi:hypothetical protein